MTTAVLDLAAMPLVEVQATLETLDPDGQLAETVRRLTAPADPHNPRIVSAFNSAL